jgi:hypothetical protein
MRHLFHATLLAGAVDEKVDQELEIALGGGLAFPVQSAAIVTHADIADGLS